MVSLPYFRNQSLRLLDDFLMRMRRYGLCEQQDSSTLDLVHTDRKQGRSLRVVKLSLKASFQSSTVRLLEHYITRITTRLRAIKVISIHIQFITL